MGTARFAGELTLEGRIMAHPDGPARLLPSRLRRFAALSVTLAGGRDRRRSRRVRQRG